MKSTTSTTYVRRLGAHHFAHLRAVAEGLDIIESAKRYLGVEHGHQARPAHQQTMDAVRAIARRHRESAWRLIGLTVRIPTKTVALPSPSLEDFIAERDLDGWSESEVAEMYAEAYPQDRKTIRRVRLRERQTDLLKTLQALAAEHPQPHDLIAGWFDDVTTQKLVSAGMLTLNDLSQRIHAGGRWYSTLPAIGATKALRIERHLGTLIPRHSVSLSPTVFLLQNTPSLLTAEKSIQWQAINSDCLIDARSDVGAIEAWVRARAGSPATAKAYRREANRMLLWLQYERTGKSLGNCSVSDCGDYLAFLQTIPREWISRRRAAPGQIGWAPFRGQLSKASYQQAVITLGVMFSWLSAVRYIGNNPWLLLNTTSSDDKEDRLLDTKALSDGAMKEVLSFMASQPPSPSLARIKFVLKFTEAVGLRSSELLLARLQDISFEPEGWVMQVHGKASKNRIVALPGQAIEALQSYLNFRGLIDIQTAPPEAPLISSTLDPMEPIGYQALYEHVKGWLKRAIAASALPTNERLRLYGASTHWLRHTFGTRSVARDVPLDVIQAQMGHSSIQTTMSIYGRAPIGRRVRELEKAFSGTHVLGE